MFFFCFASLLNFLPGFASARSADASVEFHVTDDRGVPVHDAKVEVIFDMLGLARGTRIAANTDSNGVCRVKGRTAGVLKIQVAKDGYYRTRDEICLITMGKEHEIKWGKWQPWGMERKIILPKVRNPVAIQPPWGKTVWRFTKQRNEWVGFDIMAYDYVTPWGKGTTSDFEVYYEWDGKRFKNYNGMSATIRFPQKYAGAYWQDKFSGTDFDGVYAADPDAAYVSGYKFYTRVERDHKGKIVKEERHMPNQGEILVGRSRCKLNEAGKLESAIYFKIAHLSFCCDENGVGIRGKVYYNPTPNDTNLEPKR